MVWLIFVTFVTFVSSGGQGVPGAEGPVLGWFPCASASFTLHRCWSHWNRVLLDGACEGRFEPPRAKLHKTVKPTFISIVVCSLYWWYTMLFGLTWAGLMTHFSLTYPTEAQASKYVLWYHMMVNYHPRGCLIRNNWTGLYFHLHPRGIFSSN